MARKNKNTGDLCYLTGLVFRSVSALNQTLFAYHRVWCLNEKKAVLRVGQFACSPQDYVARIQRLFSQLASQPDAALEDLKQLCDETARICEKEQVAL